MTEPTPPAANYQPQTYAPAAPYAPGPPTTNLNQGTVNFAGGNQPHNNMQPYLVLNFIIAIVGIFPSRN